MPFTVSHIAAVVPAYRPLSRARLFTAAVIGSMVPDFGFLLMPGDLARWQTHSLPALISFCLPVGLAAYALTVWLIKPALLQVLPNGAYARLQAQELERRHGALPQVLSAAGAGGAVAVRSMPSSGHGAAALARVQLSEPEPVPVSTHGGSRWIGSWPRWLSVPLVLLLGALTHLLWDGFTHENGAQMFPELLSYGPQLAGHTLRLYTWLQYGSSVFGLAVLAVALVLWLHHAPAPRPAPPRRLGAPERAGWLALYVGLPLAALTWVTIHPLLAHRFGPLGWELTRAAIVSLRSTAVSLVLVSAVLRLRLLA